MSTAEAGVSHRHRAVAWLRSGGAVRLFKYGLGSIVLAESRVERAQVGERVEGIGIVFTARFAHPIERV